MRTRSNDESIRVEPSIDRWMRVGGRVSVVAALAVAIACILIAPTPTFADGPKPCDDSMFAILGGLGLCEKGLPGLLEFILGTLTFAVGVPAAGGLVWAGILYASADGNAEQVKKAKDMIRNVVVGLVVFAVMALALQWLFPKPVFCDKKQHDVHADDYCQSMQDPATP